MADLWTGAQSGPIGWNAVPKLVLKEVQFIAMNTLTGQAWREEERTAGFLSSSAAGCAILSCHITFRLWSGDSIMLKNCF